MKKIMLFLATQKGFDVLKYLLKTNKDNIGVVISFDEIGVIKNWCVDIDYVCKINGIPFYKWGTIKSNLIEIIKCNDITGIICISWRYLLPLDRNNYLEDKIIVFHDSLLPKYRGFAPVVTAMLCKEKEIGATAIFADDGADTGDIIFPKRLEINHGDYISDVIERMSSIYVDIADFIVNRMISGNLPRLEQNEAEDTYSIWRDENNYWINWNSSAEDIALFVRALGDPYECAKTLDRNTLIRIKRCSVWKNDMIFPLRNPGKIWSIKNNTPLVICGNGILRIEEAYDENGKKHNFTELRSKLGVGGKSLRPHLLLTSDYQQFCA